MSSFSFPKSSLVPHTKVSSKYWIGERFWINFKQLKMSFLFCLVAPDSYRVQEKKTAASSRPHSAIAGQNSNHPGNKPGTRNCGCCGKGGRPPWRRAGIQESTLPVLPPEHMLRVTRMSLNQRTSQSLDFLFLKWRVNVMPCLPLRIILPVNEMICVDALFYCQAIYKR